MRPAKVNGSAVILLHGMADYRQGVMGFAYIFLMHGYAVLLPGSRAHAESGGSLTG
jgi:alpha-beta hydrolase superfamily lysophospholipase